MAFNKIETDKFIRVTKPVARKLHRAGAAVTVVPCNIRVDNVWRMGYTITKSNCEVGLFDREIDAYEWYNCNAEVGYYASFYVGVDDYKKYMA